MTVKTIAKIFGKIFLAIIALLLIAFAVLYLAYNEPLPKGTSGVEADKLATKMLQAVSHETYKNTRYLSWTFPSEHHYIWDKDQSVVEVSWDTSYVKLNLKQPEQSYVSVDGEEITGETKTKKINQARSYFHNDSFWLVAPHKVFDEGVTRSVVKLDDGSDALLVTYASGGTTPGDSYLWILDENYRPKAYQMWVKIIPIGGLHASWENWQTTAANIPLSTKHKILFMNLSLKNVKAWN